MDRLSEKIKEITIISIGVSIIIGGGFAIIMFSSAFPIPGLKFILMSPYLSTVIYVIQSKVGSKFAVLKLGLVFAFIMTIINFYMGIAILLTTLATHFSIMIIKKHERRSFWGSVLFSGYTGIFALSITKLFVGGVIANISNIWIVIVGLLCSCFGIIGTYIAKKVLRHIRLETRR